MPEVRGQSEKVKHSEVHEIVHQHQGLLRESFETKGNPQRHDVNVGHSEH